MSNRHLARTLTLQALFAWDFQGCSSENLESILQYTFGEFAPDFDDQGFARGLLQGVVDNRQLIDNLIIKYAPEWPLDQITIVDRNVLRIGIFELKFSSEIPPKVAINESIELAKTFGGESSGKFINGVLGSIYKIMEEQGEKQGMDKPTMSDRQFSAGGVVWRKFDSGIKIALILDGHGRWTFSKGRIESGEKEEEAAKREIGEELGIKNIKVGEKIGELELTVREPNIKPYPKTVYLYLVEALEDDLTPATSVGEIKDAKWFDMEEVHNVLGYDQAKAVWQTAKEKILK